MKRQTTKLPKIKQLPSGNFQARVYAGKDADGKAVYKSITRPTYAEVQMELATFKVEHKEEKAQAAANRTVRDAIQDYININSSVFSPSTVRLYNGLLRNSLQSLMSVKLSQIDQNTVQKAVNAESARGVSPKTVRNAYGLFTAAMAAEMPDRVFRVNLPQKVRSDISIPTEEEVKKLLETAEGTDMELPVLLGACCGMRRSEIGALTWGDIDIQSETISINQAMVLGDDHQLNIKGTKTTAGKRLIKLFPFVTAKLSSARVGKASTDHVTIDPIAISNRWRWVLRHSGVKHYRFHDLRHYLVSVMLSLNVPKKYIADYVGHETEDMIDQVYGHIMASKKTSIQEELQEYFTGVFGKCETKYETNSKSDCE